MLFDLQSPRRRAFIRVIYAMLALLMGGGLLLFGIGGGSGGGGILDALGITNGNGSGGGGDPFKDQINQAQAKLAANPHDQQALISLVTLHVQAGQQKLDVQTDSSGQQTTSPTPESNDEFSKAADNWALYLKTKPAKPNFAAATQVAQAYLYLAESSTSATDADINLQGAANAQKVAAAQQPTLGSLSTLAQYLYFAGDTAGADQAAQQALAKADSSNKQALQQQLDQLKKVGAQIRQQIDAAAKQEKQQAQAGAGASGASGSTGGNPFQNPLGSSGALGGQ